MRHFHNQEQNQQENKLDLLINYAYPLRSIQSLKWFGWLANLEYILINFTRKFVVYDGELISQTTLYQYIDHNNNDVRFVSSSYTIFLSL